MQYRQGTATVVNGSDEVVGTGVDWSQIPAGSLFSIPDTEGVYYVSEVVGPTQVNLTAAYTGPSRSNAVYWLTKDFTPFHAFPIPGKNDLDVTRVLEAALLKIDAKLTPGPVGTFSVRDKDLTSPPASPQEGWAFIVPASSTGAWSGFAGKIALYRSGAWTFHAASDGAFVRANDENKFYFYRADTNVWELNPLSASDSLTLAGQTLAQVRDWNALLNKPATFAPSTHVHVQSDITGLVAALASKASTGATGSFADLYVGAAGGTTGIIYLGQDQTSPAYLYWNGGSYAMPSGPLLVNGSQVWTAATFNPGAKLNITDASVLSETGRVVKRGSTGEIYAQDIIAARSDGTGVIYFGSYGSRYLHWNGTDYSFGSPTGETTVWHAGNFNPASKSNVGHVHAMSDITGLGTALSDRDAAIASKANLVNPTFTGDVSVGQSNNRMLFHAPGNDAFYIAPLSNDGSAWLWSQQLMYDRVNARWNFNSLLYSQGHAVHHAGNFNPADKANASHSHDWAQVTGKPDLYVQGSTLNLPGVVGSKFETGTGDAATFATYNTALGGWYGLGMKDLTNGSINGVYDFRTGSWNVKGGYLINGVSVWHPGNFDPGSYSLGSHSHAWSAITDKPTLLSQVAAIDYTALDSAPAYGITTVGYPGFSKTLLAFNPGGSTGNVQQEFHYQSGGTGFWRVRNKLDSNTWQPWKHVMLHDDAQAPISGTVFTSTNLSTSVPLLADQLFNNKGISHGTPSAGFGGRFFYNDGPNSTQAYGINLGLGSNYASTSYSVSLAIPRKTYASEGYLHYQYTENSGVDAWAKIKAGYADTAGGVTGKPNLLSFSHAHLGDWTPATRGATYLGGWHGTSGSGDQYVAFGSSTGQLHWTIDGDYYANNGLSKVWHEGNFDPATKFNTSGGALTGSITTTNGADRSITLASSTSYNYQLITAGDHFQIREASDAAKVRMQISYPSGNVDFQSSIVRAAGHEVFHGGNLWPVSVNGAQQDISSRKRFTSSAGTVAGDFWANSYQNSALEVFNADGNRGAYMSFHTTGIAGIKFGMNTNAWLATDAAGMSINGSTVYHTGNFDPATKATLGNHAVFADMTASRFFLTANITQSFLNPNMSNAAQFGASTTTLGGILTDRLAFTPPTTATWSTDGTNFTSITIPRSIFKGMISNQWGGFNIPTSVQKVRFTWSPLGYVFMDDFVASCSTNGRSMRFIFEKSADGSTWLPYFTSGWGSTWPGYISHKLDGTPGGEYPHFRITIECNQANSNDITIGGLSIMSSYGGSSPLYIWDVDKNFTLQGSGQFYVGSNRVLHMGDVQESAVADSIVRRSGGGYITANWFNANSGVYSANSGVHFDVGNQTWGASLYANQSAVQLAMRTAGNTTRGYVYADNGNNIGFLDSSGNWKLQLPDSGAPTIRVNNTLRTVFHSGDSTTYANVRDGAVSVYDSTQTQAIWAMGPSYKLPAGGASGNYGDHYGLGWSYEPNHGGAGNNAQSKAGLSHQMLLQHYGVTHTAIGTGIWTTGRIECAGNGGWTMGSYGDKNRIDYDGSKFRFLNSANQNAQVEMNNLFAASVTASGNLGVSGNANVNGVTTMHRPTTANDTYHLELSRVDSGIATDPIYVRFHHYGRWYSRIKADNTGFSLVSGADESFVGLKTGALTVNGEFTAASGSVYTSGGLFYNSNWWRSTGATGWFNSTYSTGIYCDRAGQVRTYNGGNFHSEGTISAAGVIIASVEGFQSASYQAGRNRIWSFANSDGYGMSYFREGTDTIGFHFGSSALLSGSAHQFSATGSAYHSGALTATGATFTSTVSLAADTWHNSGDGQNRFHFSTNSHSFYRTNAAHIFYNSAHSTIATLDASGNLTVPGTMYMAGWSVSSDKRIKSDFRPVENTGDLIDAMNVVSFAKRGVEGRQVGVIAQELQQISPGLVRESADLFDDGSALLSVDANSIMFLMLAEMKALRSRVAELEARA